MADAVIAVPALRTANKAQVAEFFGVSLPAVDQWIRKGCPYVQKGAKGVSWVFDLLQVAEWRFAGPSTSPEEQDPESLPPKERKDWFDSELKRRALQVRDRELIECAEVERVVATAFATISHAVRSIPDNVERLASPGPKVLEAIEQITDESMNALADQLGQLAPLVTETEET